MVLTELKLEQFHQEQALLDQFKNAAQHKTELERFELAKKLFEEWSRQGLNLAVFPGVPERQDFWYLAQVFALEREISKDGTPYHFSLTATPKLYLSESPEVMGDGQLDPHHFQTRLLHFDEFIRLAPLYGWIDDSHVTLFNEFRLTTDGQTQTFFGGDNTLGSQRFIDSYWSDQPLKNAISRIVIIEST